MAITHTFVSGKSDTADATKVRASNWNVAHTVTDAENETPTGTPDGQLTVFTLAASPSPTASLMLFRNGLLQTQGVDYTLSGSTITFLMGAVPQTGDLLRAWYRI